MSSIIKPRRSGGVIGTIGPIGGSGVFSLQERHALSVDNYDDVVLYLKMNGANGSTSFLDSSQYGHTVTANGDAQISTAESKFGGASAEFDGTGDHLSVAADAAFDFGSGDFTIEMFARIASANNFGCLVSKGQPATINSTVFSLEFRENNTVLSFFVGSIGLGTYIITGTTNVRNSNTWHHVAVCRNGNATKLFIDGVQEGATYAGSYTIFPGNSLFVAGGFFSPSTNNVNGYIDDLRITKGVARYTGNFTPPQREFLP